jgi:hypothetical protein
MIKDSSFRRGTQGRGRRGRNSRETRMEET